MELLARFVYIFALMGKNKGFAPSSRREQQSTGLARDLPRMFFRESTTPPAEPVVSKCALWGCNTKKSRIIFSLVIYFM